MRPAIVGLLAAVALLTGCSDDSEEPPAVAVTTQTPEPTAAEPTESGAAPADPGVVPLEFGGSTGATIDADCADRAPAFLATYQTMTVNQEVRLGEVTLSGGGRFVGEVTIGPSGKRTDSGALVAGDEPGYAAAITRLPGWQDRVPVQGQPVQPGSYTIFAQLRLAPGEKLDGLDFAWTDSNATGSSRLLMPVEVVERCGDG